MQDKKEPRVMRGSILFIISFINAVDKLCELKEFVEYIIIHYFPSFW